MKKLLIGVTAFLFANVGFSAPERAETLVLRKEGFPDQEACSILWKKKGAALADIHGKLEELVEQTAGKVQLVSYDGMVSTDHLQQLWTNLADGKRNMILFIKSDDREVESYTKFCGDEQGRKLHLANPHQGESIFGKTIEELGLAMSEGAKHLSVGLSKQRSEEGRFMRAVFVTWSDKEEILDRIMAAEGEELRKLLEIGQHYEQKSKSQIDHTISLAKANTERFGIGGEFALVSGVKDLDLVALGERILDETGAQISIFNTKQARKRVQTEGETVATMRTVYSYSIRAVAPFSAREFAHSFEFNGHRGGGGHDAAGFTTLLSPDEVISKFVAEHAQYQIEGR